MGDKQDLPSGISEFHFPVDAISAVIHSSLYSRVLCQVVEINDLLSTLKQSTEEGMSLNSICRQEK